MITNRYYIGMHSTDNLNDGYMGSGKRLWRSFNKYGRDKHTVEILEFLPNRLELKAREKELVNEETLKDCLCMNLVIGGDGGNIKISDCVKGGKNSRNTVWVINGEKNRELLIKLTMERLSQKKYMDIVLKNINWTGRKHSEQTKVKIGKANSIKQSGEGNSQYGTCWIMKDGLNKKIKKEEFETYINEGWVKGRKLCEGS